MTKNEKDSIFEKVESKTNVKNLEGRRKTVLKEVMIFLGRKF